MFARIDDNAIAKFNLTHASIRRNALIGKGAFGEVYAGIYQQLIRDENNEIVGMADIPVAIKRPTKPTLEDNCLFGPENTVLQYVMSLCDLNPAYRACFVTFYGFTSNFRNEEYILSYANAGDWRQWLEHGPRDWNECKSISLHVAQALSVLHANDVLHGDVKPDNVLLHRASPNAPIQGQLTDFGSADSISEPHRRSRLLGSPLFYAPECIIKKDMPADPRGTFNTTRSDVYAYGNTLLMAIVGNCDPFGINKKVGNTAEERNLYAWTRLHRMVVTEPLDFTFDAKIANDIIAKGSDLLYPLAAWCLAKNPDERPTATMIVKAHNGMSIPARFFTLPKIKNSADVVTPQFGVNN